MKIFQSIHNLVNYSVQERFLNKENSNYAINQLIEMLGLKHFKHQGTVEEVNIKEDIANILIYARNSKIIENNKDEKIFESLFLDCLIDKPSGVIATFNSFENKQEAMDWFLKLNKFTKYIDEEKRRKNVSFEMGGLKIAINNVKPEIKKTININGKYPTTPISADNVGYLGGEHYALRRNHRIIPMKLGGTDMYFQFSPYAYFNYHGILFTKEITPMLVSENSINILIDFIEAFPMFGAFSNSDKVGAGVSILGHQHFQVGIEKFPYEDKEIKKIKKIDEVEFGILDWPVSCIVLESTNRTKILEQVKRVIKIWKNFKYESKYFKNESNNTFSVAVKKEENKFKVFLFLRNNAFSNDFPHGIYNIPSHVHAIKKEGIGVIEVIGMAIFPGRLIEQLKNIDDQNGSDWVEWKKWISNQTKQSDGIGIEEMLQLTYQEILNSIGLFNKDPRLKDKLLKEILW